MLKRLEMLAAQDLVVELLRLLPGKFLVGEVAVLRSLLVDGLCEIEFLDNDSWSHIEIRTDNLYQLVRALIRRAVSFDE